MKFAIICGTRPEVIKIAMLHRYLRAISGVEVILISTGQHREMIAPLFDWFDITPSYDLSLMQPGQTPQGLLARAQLALDEVLESEKPDLVIVQGDTSTALAGALAAYHRKIPVAHIEAGLRTGDIYSPFPEEGNRSLIGRLATWHFAPTQRAVDVLEKECVPGTIHLVGNTVVDALQWTAERVKAKGTSDQKVVLITAHRRENFGNAMNEALDAIADVARQYPDVRFVYPVHRNPNVLELAHAVFKGIANVELIEPLPYPEMVDLLRSSYLVLTDSGGIQEEAPTFGIPLIIMRESTERSEVIDVGIGQLVGTNATRIRKLAKHFLDNPSERAKIASIPNPFGDGTTSKQIGDILVQSQSE
ncbi:UDP-N-acetylglucosamine 2-epimerase (non-hydrolyzing) [Phyllobacterium sp. CCNWLW109]|uniref:non-hydrolyzing UDP-N-acetylglucosamine 2-epimerase n=1 Tax=Phyllobacterium sp. CCNWLW109 TaxID=3127479 RepID=UPI00307895C6